MSNETTATATATATKAIAGRDPKPTPERIKNLASRVLEGDIVLPEFQRRFVWDRHQIINLLDSIYRNYPIGSLLVWESSQRLQSKRSIADLTVAERRGTYPVNYLLDGQQRLSTVCGVLHWEPGDKNSIWNVAFDLEKLEFVHVDILKDFPLHLIPMRRLADPAEFFRHLTPLTDPELNQRASLLFNRFTDYQVPLVTLADMPLNDVAPVFERINSTGTRLTIVDLMRAATWSTSFDLGKSIEGIREALEPKRFSGLEEKVLLRALSASAGSGFTVENINALRDRDEPTLKTAVASTKKAAKLACDFLATEVGVPRHEALPYSAQFAVLCEIFRQVATPDSKQIAEIRGWFWRTTLSGYFGGWNTGQMNRDIAAVRAWTKGEKKTIEIGSNVVSSDKLWRDTGFRSNSAVSKMAGLMLSQVGPIDILNGQKIDFDKSLAWSNDKEYHHFFPQAYLARNSVRKLDSNVVANIVLLTSVSNIKIKDKAPSAYLQEIIDKDGRSALLKRLEANLISEAALDAALKDDFTAFLAARSLTLQDHALALCRTASADAVVVATTTVNIDDSTDAGSE
ncbi:MAG: DUF262 domain-containing protein [Rhodococcus qingshengii]|uniref:GmrSD restriction endonuclease domain-containing protein n=1 Tax=Rhodococcus qingshengii TaxID=334542 RepID=UPI001AE8F541|nr:DUF262 domain-containing protein [Rhodococcus qingshengii]MBP1049102.1 DUF262 domain-containing protein [Rhodococcus qingshengii]WCT01535.1 DUF262 domain-containing protein [Rhodococcus qingshengii]